MHYKLICSDIDGTLLDINRKLSSETIEAVKRIHPSIPFILVSSRMPKSIRLLQKELDTYDSPLIAYNGALIIGKHGKVINSVEILNKKTITTKNICIVYLLIEINKYFFF
jgi:HAD superfamily hydrolase (TIGR01484 family)